MRKVKPHDIAFEDRVWAAFAKLHFTAINKGRYLNIQYGKADGQIRQVNVFAADEDVLLVVECKSSETVRTLQLKKEIEAIHEQRAGILREVKREFANHKVKFILATNNIGVSAQTAERIAAADVVHMDDDVVDYYIELAEHLGRAARYQLLGSLFAGTRIPNLDAEVVAIEAKMGGHKYYSFSIEPERLLKLAYILHRNKANTNLMPTYQRLVKKARLKNVAAFVESGGYFPNSLILSLDAGRRGPQFDPFPRHLGDTRAGILHLPQTYRAAYVIDGQHRLYGYADSYRAGNDLIPVVAFVDLERADQVRLFMQINENQQAVPKNLRNTLNADLLSESLDLREQIRALKLQIAQQLGESKASPLYGRILIGENNKTATRCITIDAVSRGLERANFLGSFTKTEVREWGTFYRGSNDATLGPLLDYLSQCFSYICERLDLQFRLGSAEGGFVFINNGIESLIRIFGDIADHLIGKNGYDSRQISPSELFAEAKFYLDPMIAMLSALSPAQGKEYRGLYGSGAGTKYWRRLQLAIHAERQDFDPPGLSEYLEGEEKQFNTESFEMISSIEHFLKDDIRQRLQDEYGSQWFKRGVPKKIQLEAGRRAVEKNVDRPPGEEVEAWDCLYIIEYQTILQQSSELWKRLFEKRYTRPGDENLPGTWKQRSGWFRQLNELRNDIAHGRSITSDGHDFLVTLSTWLVKGQADNDL
ncbi:DGQHR domain-containing protein [Amycolatopsis japonica]|uniref:DGQHR domain-containing protein n=1 Tax=Amycolatopsis japonica TaxID=208439 RepID=UPI00379B8DA5